MERVKLKWYWYWYYSDNNNPARQVKTKWSWEQWVLWGIKQSKTGRKYSYIIPIGIPQIYQNHKYERKGIYQDHIKISTCSISLHSHAWIYMFISNKFDCHSALLLDVHVKIHTRGSVKMWPIYGR